MPKIIFLPRAREKKIAGTNSLTLNPVRPAAPARRGARYA
jgi:hypothetical protein